MGSMPEVAVAANISREAETGRENVDAGVKAAAPKPITVKSLPELVTGEVFSAEILDIQPGVVTLKVGANTLAARTLVSPDARIGDKAAFLVKDNTSGQIVLEFLREKGSALVSASIVKEALAAANMQLTQGNSELIEQLVYHNLPIDNHSVQRAAFFRYSMSDAPFSQIGFLLENKFAPIERTVEVFQGLLSGELNIKDEAGRLQTAIEAVNDGELREHLSAMVRGKLTLDVENGPDLGRYLSQLRTLMKEMAEFLRQGGDEAAAKAAAVRQAMANIGDIVDFVCNIGETKLYYQFPFILSGRENMAELHVMKRKGKSPKKGGSKNATALIALNMANLGRIEVLVNKTDRNVNLQFRSDSGLSLYAINGESNKLSEMLGDKGFLLTGLGLKMLGEKFDLTQDLIKDRDKKEAALKAVTEESGPKRYTFDMRV